MNNLVFSNEGGEGSAGVRGTLFLLNADRNDDPSDSDLIDCANIKSECTPFASNKKSQLQSQSITTAMSLLKLPLGLKVLQNGNSNYNCQMGRRARLFLLFLVISMIILDWILGILFLFKAGGASPLLSSVSRFIGGGLVLTSLGGVGAGITFIFAALIYRIAICFYGPINEGSTPDGAKSTSTHDRSYKPSQAKVDSIYCIPIIRLAWQTAIIGWSLTVIIGLIAIKVALLLMVA